MLTSFLVFIKNVLIHLKKNSHYWPRLYIDVKQDFKKKKKKKKTMVGEALNLGGRTFGAEVIIYCRVIKLIFSAFSEIG